MRIILVLAAGLLLAVLCWQWAQALADVLDGLRLPGPR